MSKNGPVILIDDDADDCELVKEAIAATGYSNEVITFSDSSTAFDGLCRVVDASTPFIILCDINLPRINGIELKQKIDSDSKLRSKSIPFVFLSTTGEGHFVTQAYDCCTVQGFFVKEARIKDMIASLKLILDYWKKARTPNH